MQIVRELLWNSCNLFMMVLAVVYAATHSVCASAAGALRWAHAMCPSPARDPYIAYYETS